MTVSERGQIVILAEARRDFGIKTGDKLLVFSDLERGLGTATFAIMRQTMAGAMDLFQEVDSTMATPREQPDSTAERPDGEQEP